MKKTYAVMLAMLLSVFVSNASYAQTCLTFPLRGVQIIDQFLSDPTNLTLAKGTDDQRRLLTKQIAEQMRFELGNWSTKSADSGRPQSKDSLAFPMGDDTFCNFDWQNGDTRLRSINANTRGTFIADQHLLPTAAVNHLGIVVGSPGPVEPPVSSVSDDPAFVALNNAVIELQHVVAELNDRLSSQVANLQQADGVQNDRLSAAESAFARIDAFLATKPIPATCKASLFGIGVSCRLE